MIKLNEKSKVRINWNVSPYNFSKEEEKNIIEKFSKKYSFPKDNIKVIPNFLMIDENGKELSVTKDIISNIQNTDFQISLFKEYIKANNIENVNFDLIKSIDAEINENINYDVYDKYKHYKLKWIKWNNFLSYGENNFFDFSSLNGLVLIQGMSPFSNQTGKTTFSIDLLHFLLFGNTSKVNVQSKLFNKYLPESTEIVVEGCICIDGIDFLIKRTLTRPSLSKRTSKSKTVQKVEYYKLIGDDKEELSDYVDGESNNGENVSETNKIIKESIGNASDFDLMICATMNNLEDIISMKNTDRGLLFSKWIGLLPIEQKDKLAREKFNGDIKPSLLSNRYSTEALKNEIEAFNFRINECNTKISEIDENVKIATEELNLAEKERTLFLSSLSKIDNLLINVDVQSLKNQLEKISEDGKRNNLEIANITEELKKFGDINYSIEEHDKIISKITEINNIISEIRFKCLHIKENIKQLKESEFCPTCGRKYDNVDNSVKIKKLSVELDKLINDGKEANESLIQLNNTNALLKEKRANLDSYNKMTVKKSALEVKREQLINKYMEAKQVLKKCLDNMDSIKKNKDLEIKINISNENIKDKNSILKQLSDNKNEMETNIKLSSHEISERQKTIEKIKKETEIVYNWKIYLEMIGKNGISKMVLRKTLPIINSNVSSLLNGVCDFTVEVRINDKNEIAFDLLKDGVRSELSSGSGFELTCGALALRAVLAKISTIPHPNFFVADEVLAAVSSENMENMKKLFEKISKDYDFILNVTHDETIKDWFQKIIHIKKVNNISKIEL